MDIFEYINSDEIKEFKLHETPCAAIVYDEGTYDIYKGVRLVGCYISYDEAYENAVYHGYETRYYPSLESYRNRHIPLPHDMNTYHRDPLNEYIFEEPVYEVMCY